MIEAPESTESIVHELREIRDLLERLVAMEMDRRQGERQMEAVAESLLPSSDEPSPTPDWYRDRRGIYRERGTERQLASDEIEAVTYSPRRSARQR